MKNAGKARSYGLYRHLRTSKEIIENLLNYYLINKVTPPKFFPQAFLTTAPLLNSTPDAEDTVRSPP